jgi:hypothetical protein
VTLATWIALAIVALGVVLLAWASLSLLRRLARFNTAAAGMQTRAEQALALQSQLAALEPNVAELTARLEHITSRFGRR